MKKFLVLSMFSLLSFIGVNFVNADTYDFEYSLEEYSESGLTEEQLIQYTEDKLPILIEYWEKNLKKDYPYYYIGINTSIIGSRVDLDFHYFKTLPLANTEYFGQLTSLVDSTKGVLNISIYCSETASTCYDEIIERPSTFNGYFNPVFYYSQPFNEILYKHYLPFSYYDSNFILRFNEDNTFNIVKNNEILYSLNKGDFIPTYKDLFTNNLLDDYTEINLNNYSYIILSLKDYTPRETFTVYGYYKGQYCPTTVYNYGMEEKKDYISGYQTQPCINYSNSFSPSSFYIKSEDIENHAVYYLNVYDSSKPNIIKVSNSIFNITYITSENENNPYVDINNKKYPTIPYSELTDTSILTEINGINPTWTCAKYDTNCFINSTGIDIETLFSNPMEMLKTIWGTIISIFALITEFIILLPLPMQGFLYIAFGIGIALGVLKIIL